MFLKKANEVVVNGIISYFTLNNYFTIDINISKQKQKQYFMTLILIYLSLKKSN